MKCPDCQVVTFRYRRDGTWLEILCGICLTPLGGIDVARAIGWEVDREVA